VPAVRRSTTPIPLLDPLLDPLLELLPLLEPPLLLEAPLLLEPVPLLEAPLLEAPPLLELPPSTAPTDESPPQAPESSATIGTTKTNREERS
jgi:hypothetical protein